jgi:CubicO group peptidase (beta-lactamase class C family)
MSKAGSGFFPGFWDNRGWGFGMSVVTRRDHVAPGPGSFGWDGGFGTSGYTDPAEEMVGILMTQGLLDAAVMDLNTDFWTSAYQSIDD